MDNDSTLTDGRGHNVVTDHSQASRECDRPQPVLTVRIEPHSHGRLEMRSLEPLDDPDAATQLEFWLDGLPLRAIVPGDAQPLEVRFVKSREAALAQASAAARAAADPLAGQFEIVDALHPAFS